MKHRKRFSAVAGALAIVAAVALLALRETPASAERQAEVHSAAVAPHAQQIRIIDGDTLQDMAADITYRLVNIDTPETGPRARCAAERELGNRATAEASALVARAADVELRPTGRIDRYGRTIAFVLIDGRDLGETLIAQGLARPWRGRREPWCDASGNLIP